MRTLAIALLLLPCLAACGEQQPTDSLRAGTFRLSRIEGTRQPMRLSWTLEATPERGTGALFSFEEWADGACVENCGAGASKSGLWVELEAKTTRTITVEVEQLQAPADAQPGAPREYRVTIQHTESQNPNSDTRRRQTGAGTEMTYSFRGEEPVMYFARSGTHAEGDDVVLFAIVNAEGAEEQRDAAPRCTSGNAVYLELTTGLPSR